MATDIQLQCLCNNFLHGNSWSEIKECVEDYYKLKNTCLNQFRLTIIRPVAKQPIITSSYVFLKEAKILGILSEIFWILNISTQFFKILKTLHDPNKSARRISPFIQITTLIKSKRTENASSTQHLQDNSDPE